MKLLKYKNLYFAISLFFLVPGLISLVLFGLKPAIDFTGGSLLEVKLEENIDASSFNREAIQSAVGDIYEIDSVQTSGSNQLLIRGKTIDNNQKNIVLEKINENLTSAEEIRFSTVGPVLGKELLIKTLAAIAVVSTIITLYVWKQFDELMYGVSAIMAMFHDSFILLGAFSLFGYFYGVEVDVLFVTALLTTLSFSIHDTIVVYDRIRELKRKHKRQSFENIANAAVLETLGRSLNNSITIILMLLALVLLGGATIKWFAIALLIGAVAGTYSSTFTAVPLLLFWVGRKKKK